MSKSRKTVFSSEWNNPFVNPQWSTWLREKENDCFSAKCLLCRTTFALSNMGKQAVQSHERGKKHSRNLANRSITVDIKDFLSKQGTERKSKQRDTSNCNTETFLCNDINRSEERVNSDMPNSDLELVEPSKKLIQTEPESSKVQSLNSGAVSRSKRPCIGKFLQKDNVTKAEVIWCLGSVSGHHSARSSATSVLLFKDMFPDSDIAVKMKLQKDKISYTVTYGLAPFFRNSLTSHLAKCDYFVIGFDESFNKISQKEQMDFFVRFWDDEKQQVTMRYLDSRFLGHTTATDLLAAFNDTLKEFDMKKLIQVSMDGPNVNWKFFNNLKADISQSNEDPTLLNVGSCGLHVLNGAFKTGINSTGWKIIEFLRALYNLFKHVPARRGDYALITKSSLFPLRFCSIRWVENVKFAERALQILPNVKVYVAFVQKKKTGPTCNSFKVVVEACKDPLLSGKLAFFQSLAAEVEPFLRKYQSEAPLFPLLFEDLHKILRRVLGRFTKKSVLDQANTAKKLFSIIFTKETLLPSREIDLGFATRSAIRASGKLSELTLLEFRKDCALCLNKFVEKFIDKSPLKYKLTFGASCLSPAVILNAFQRQARVRDALNVLVEGNWFSGITADKIQVSYEEFCCKEEVICAMKKFNQKTDRLDHLFIELLQDHDCAEMTQFFKLVLILSHGNAGLERGFSVNSNCLVENLQEDSLIAQRLVYDTIVAAGGVSAIVITKSMLQYARNASSVWLEALKTKQQDEKSEGDLRHKRKMVTLKVKELETKKLKLVSDAQKEADTIDVHVKSLLQAL